MKKSILFLSAFFICGFIQAQKLSVKEVPASVKASFAKMYPNAKGIKWEKEGNDFEAEFNWKSAESSAVYDASGSFKESETEIKAEKLSASIRNYCEMNYAGYQIDEASEVMDASGVVTYEVEMKYGKKHFEATFDSEGNFIKKTIPTLKEDDKD